MYLEEFCTLDAAVQQTIALEFGIFLFERSGVHVKARLYQLDGFYIEVFLNLETGDVLRLNPFSDVTCLAPYISQVNIDEIRQLL